MNNNKKYLPDMTVSPFIEKVVLERYPDKYIGLGLELRKQVNQRRYARALEEYAYGFEYYSVNHQKVENHLIGMS